MLLPLPMLILTYFWGSPPKARQVLLVQACAELCAFRGNPVRGLIKLNTGLVVLSSFSVFLSSGRHPLSTNGHVEHRRYEFAYILV